MVEWWRPGGRGRGALPRPTYIRAILSHGKVKKPGQSYTEEDNPIQEASNDDVS